MRKRAWWWVSFSVVLLWSASVFADSRSAQLAFNEGRKAFKAGEIDRACDLFEKSHELDAQPGTLLNMARCHAEQGRVATAWAEYSEVADVLRGDERGDYAKKQIPLLEAKLHRIRITSVPPDATVAIDGKAQNPVALSLPIPIDPGPRSIRVTAEGRKPFVTTVSIPAEAGETSLAIPALEEGAPVEARLGPQPGGDGDRVDKDEGGLNGLVIAGIVVGGLGVVGLAVGGGLGATVLSDTSDYGDDCDPVQAGVTDCQDRFDEIDSRATGADIALGVGGALTAGGIVLLAVGLATDGGEDEAAEGLFVRPYADAGLAVGGRF